jgi:hypothetical protein
MLLFLKTSSRKSSRRSKSHSKSYSGRTKKRTKQYKKKSKQHKMVMLRSSNLKDLEKLFSKNKHKTTKTKKHTKSKPKSHQKHKQYLPAPFGFAQAPAYGAPKGQAPAYGAPKGQAPAYGAPKGQAPAYGAPSPQAPVAPATPYHNKQQGLIPILAQPFGQLPATPYHNKQQGQMPLATLGTTKPVPPFAPYHPQQNQYRFSGKGSHKVLQKGLKTELSDLVEKVRKVHENKKVQRSKKRLDKCIKKNCRHDKKSKSCHIEHCSKELKKYNKRFQKAYKKL